MSTAKKGQKRSNRAGKPSAMRNLKVKPLEGSKVRGGYYSRLGIEGESKDTKHGPY